MGRGHRSPIGEPLTGHRGAVNSVAFSPDGERIVSGGADRTLRLWDAGTGAPGRAADDRPQELRYRGWRSARTAGASSPSSADDTVRLWDAATGQPSASR